MKARRGIRSVVLLVWAGSAVLAWAAPPGVTEKVGQTRSTPVPAPLPQAVPAGQGVRPSSGPRPSVALPDTPESPTAAVAPTAPAAPVASRSALPSASLSKRDVEVAPVAPSLAAHGLPLGVGMAPPAAGTDAGPVAKAPAPSASAHKAAAKPKVHGTAKAAARAPADREPRLRPDPVAPAASKTRGAPHSADRAGAAQKTVKRTSAHAPKPKKATPPATAKHRRNDGSRP